MTCTRPHTIRPLSCNTQSVAADQWPESGSRCRRADADSNKGRLVLTLIIVAAILAAIACILRKILHLSDAGSGSRSGEPTSLYPERARLLGARTVDFVPPGVAAPKDACGIDAAHARIGDAVVLAKPWKVEFGRMARREQFGDAICAITDRELLFAEIDGTRFRSIEKARIKFSGVKQTEGFAFANPLFYTAALNDLSYVNVYVNDMETAQAIRYAGGV